jgi:hypothetical protein
MELTNKQISFIAEEKKENATLTEIQIAKKYVDLLEKNKILNEERNKFLGWCYMIWVRMNDIEGLKERRAKEIEKDKESRIKKLKEELELLESKRS